MAEKSWWLLLLKNLISCESKPKTEKRKTKGWRWIFGRFKYKQLTATEPKRSLSEAREEQRKHALNVAKATAVAAEAAMAAAQAAAEVVRLTSGSRPCGRVQETEVQNLAAIMIQTAFRAYLARKALRALKGLVRIQAIARGRAVRRRVRTKLKHSSSSPRTKNEMTERSQLECKSQREWTSSVFTKEEIESIYLKKHEAVIRRERMKQYSFSNRERQYSQMLEELIPLRNCERHSSCPRKRWNDEENVYSKGNFENTALNLRIKPRISAKQDSMEELNSPVSHPRRSFCRMRLKHGDNNDYELSSSPVFPTYMAATESAKAKMRSMSTPRQRIRYLDACFENGSPCKNNRLFWSSFNDDKHSSLTSNAIAKAKCSQSKSLSMEVLRQA